VVRALAARPELADLLVSLTGDYAPVRELLRPRVWWDLAGPRRHKRSTMPVPLPGS